MHRAFPLDPRTYRATGTGETATVRAMKRTVVLSFALAAAVACGDEHAAPGAAETAIATPDASAPAPAPIPAPDAGPSCPAAAEPQAGVRVDAPPLDEASGLASSSVNPGHFWVHNDSGDSARAFALDGAGKLVATLAFDTARPSDIEDIAIEDDGGRSFLYFGDIGDNDSVRPKLTIHRVAEPVLGAGAAPVLLSAVSEKMTVTYPDGPHNAETLLFDPIAKELFIATKRAFGGSAIYRVGAFRAGASVTTEKVASVPIDLATGGEISRDGRLVAIRSYGGSASVWTRAPGESLAAALSRRPCSLPIAAEQQGEAFAFLADGTGYVTISEGEAPELHGRLFR